MSLAFAPNGLLAKPPPPLEKEQDEQVIQNIDINAPISFLPTGLLGGSRISTSVTTPASTSRSTSPSTSSSQPVELQDSAPPAFDESEASTMVVEDAPAAPQVPTPVDEDMEDGTHYPLHTSMTLN